MCGIIGFVGQKNAFDVLAKGLTLLEYRGYDSAGIFINGKGVQKSVGNVSTLLKKIPKGFDGSSGIAHTRWATHGVPSYQNAHPHSDRSGNVWVVHNGIIENYLEHKKILEQKGHSFQGETDSEVLAHLIGREHEKGTSLVDSVRKVLTKIRGSYAIVVMSNKEPQCMVVSRRKSPLIIGVGEKGMFVASDIVAMLMHTRRCIRLKDGDTAVIHANRINIMDSSGNSIARKEEKITWSFEEAQKDGYEHFMLKELMESPSVVSRVLEGRVEGVEKNVTLSELSSLESVFKKATFFEVVGCGSAYHAGLIGAELLRNISCVDARASFGSEFSLTQTNTENSICIVVSQSGETADTLSSLRDAKKRGVFTLALVNVVGSTIAEEADAVIYTRAGPEIAVASTKAVLSQVVLFILFACWIGKLNNVKSEEIELLLEELLRIPTVLYELFDDTTKYKDLANFISRYKGGFILGKGIHYPIALETALKLKECGYIHAEGYASGEMKHGPLALVDENFFSIVFTSSSMMYEKSLSAISECNARGGALGAVVQGKSSEILKYTKHVVTLPNTHGLLSPLILIPAGQLISYYVGKEKGINVDRPRNLAKSVTVE